MGGEDTQLYRRPQLTGQPGMKKKENFVVKMFKDLVKSMSKKRSFYPDPGAQLHKVYYLMRICVWSL